MSSSRHALRGLVSTPVRQFQLVAMLTLAVVVWLLFAVRVFRAALPRGGLAQTLADLSAGDAGERWYSFYVAILTWGHIPVVLLLALWGGALGGHAIVQAWRDPMDPREMVPAGQEPDRYIPAAFMFWGSLVLGVLTFAAANVTPMTGTALFWDEYYGLTQWVALLWWAIAAATVLAALVRMARSRRQRLEQERRRAAGRVAAAERRKAAKDARRLGKDQ